MSERVVCGVDGCQYPWSGMAPRHVASAMCESGKASHCTCDRCY